MSISAVLPAIWSILVVVAGVIMFAARTGPDEAASNISKWIKCLGWRRIPPSLRDPKIDRIVSRWAALALIGLILIFAIGVLIYLETPEQPATQRPQVITQGSRQIVYINGGADFEDNDTADKLLLVETVRDKPTTIRLTKTPRIDQKITVTDNGGIAIYAPITVFGNGNKIMGLDKYVMKVDHESHPFTFTGSNWIVE
jgi:hypothetical protein